MPKPGKNGPNRFYLVIKRGFDVLSSFFLLIILMPLLIIISLIISITDGFPIVFSQERMGRGPKLFKCYKFRTMRNDTPHYIGKSDLDDPDKYITSFGRFLRRSSFDELPQLYNILVGEMSLVGPRPIIANELNLQRLRTEAGVYSIRPGLTGYAQVSGRNDLDDVTKVKYDTYYLNHMSVGFDLKILLQTVKVVFKHDGGHEGAPETIISDEKKTDNQTPATEQTQSQSFLAGIDPKDPSSTADIKPSVSNMSSSISSNPEKTTTETVGTSTKIK